MITQNVENEMLKKQIIGVEAAKDIVGKHIHFWDLDNCIYNGVSSHKALKLTKAEEKKAKSAWKEGNHKESIKHAGNAALGYISGIASYSTKYLPVGEMKAENMGNSILHWALGKAEITEQGIKNVYTDDSIERHLFKGAIESIKAMKEKNPDSKHVILTNGSSTFVEPIVKYINEQVEIDRTICQETLFDNEGRVKGLNLKMKTPAERVNLAKGYAESVGSNLSDSVLFTNNGYDIAFKGEATLVSTEKAKTKLRLNSDYHIPNWDDFEKVIRKL